jgi:EpsI family protein
MSARTSATLCAGIVTLAALGHHWVVLSGRLGELDRPTDLALDLDRLPMELNGWSGRDVPVRDGVARQVGATAFLSREYEDLGGRSVVLTIVYHDRAKDGVAHDPIHCMPFHGWKRKENEVVRLPGPASRFQSLEAAKLLYGKGSSELVLLYWSCANGKQVPGRLHRRGDPAWVRFKRLFGSSPGYLLQVSVAARVDGSRAEAFETVERFLTQSFGAIAMHLPPSGGERVEDPRAKAQ